MTSILKNVNIDKWDHIANKSNNTFHWTIKMKPINVKPSMYIDFNKENNKGSPKLKVGDNVRISKYKNVFAKGYVPNLSEEVFMIKKVGTFYIKKLQKTNQKDFRVGKLMKRKGNKLYVRC